EAGHGHARQPRGEEGQAHQYFAGGSEAGKLSSEAWSVSSHFLGGFFIASGPASRTGFFGVACWAAGVLTSGAGFFFTSWVSGWRSMEMHSFMETTRNLEPGCFGHSLGHIFWRTSK